MLVAALSAVRGYEEGVFTLICELQGDVGRGLMLTGAHSFTVLVVTRGDQQVSRVEACSGSSV